MSTTVTKAFTVLELLIGLGRPAAIKDLAAAATLEKSNVHRLLATLKALGYVRQGDTGLYEPTLRVWEMGQRVWSAMSVTRAARAVLHRLVDETQESAHIAIFDHHEIVYLDKIDSPNPVRAYTAVGGRAPAYCTASGKALLVGQPVEAVDAVAGRAEAHTPLTIITAQRLRQEVERVRRRGYAVAVGEFRANVAGLAAPVRDGHGGTLAAVGISGPLDRLRPRDIRRHAPRVIAAATAIATALGASPA